MNTYKDPRRTLNRYILALATLVLLLTGGWAWHAYERRQAAELMFNAIESADLLIRAAGIEAVERGYSSAALGSGESNNAATREQLKALRLEGDRLWRNAESRIGSLVPALPNADHLGNYLNHSKLAFEALTQARQRLDRHLTDGGASISMREWIEAITNFISRSASLREALLSAVEMPAELTLYNKTLKHWLWQASEHAGLERGILSFYLSAGLPLPGPVRDELQAYRGVVEHNLNAILEFKDMPSLDPRVLRSMEAMNEAFLVRFQALRIAAYREAQSGDYSIPGSKWMGDATDAINHILAVSTRISDISLEYATAEKHRLTWQLMLALGGLALTALLVLIYRTKVRQIANELFHQKELAEVTLHSIGDGVITTDASARVEYLNPIAERLTGWNTQQARGRPLKEIFRIVRSVSRQQAVNPIEECLREQRVIGMENGTILIRPDGQEIHIEDSAAPIRDREGNIVGAVMVFYDVTAIPHTPHLFSFHSTHDPITGLINRREFERRLEEHLIRAKNSGETHALCYLDLDQFKVINDTCGHTAGDRLLRQFAEHLRDLLRQTDTLARLGGDEFGLLLEGCDLEQAKRIVEGIRQALRKFHFTWEDQSFDVRTCIGLAPITEHAPGVAQILAAADAACFAAKDGGRDGLQVYSPNNIKLTQRHDEMFWVSRITQALKEDRLVLYGQLIEPLRDTQPPHCEILVRMRDEQGELVPPMKFIPAAERYNLMQEIDRWVIHNTLRHIEQYLERIDADRLPWAYFNINLSGASLSQEGFHDYVHDLLAGSESTTAHRICFEITETAAISNINLVAGFMNTLKSCGCSFALDDFGSGLSSFSYLKNLPVDYLKIDGNLIQGVADDPIAFGMVQAIHRVGGLMGIRTIAEYVSNQAILDKIREIDIDYGQGFLLGQPFELATT